MLGHLISTTLLLFGLFGSSMAACPMNTTHTYTEIGDGCYRITEAENQVLLLRSNTDQATMNASVIILALL